MAKVKRRAVAHNALPVFKAKFQHPFTVEEAFIDCKEMSKNYTHGLIPLVDIAAAVDATVGPWQGRVNQYVDKLFQMINLTPYYEDVPVKNVFSHPSFNRDTSPNHCAKLERDWFDQFAMVSLGLKMPVKYGDIVLNADSTHTSTNRIRQGKAKIPFWIADVPDQGDFDSTFAYALFMAGHLFLAINVRNKRNVDIFDQHFIKVATGIYPAPQIQEVVERVAGVSIKRAGNKIAGAIHNLNETYDTFDLDEKSKKPGRLLEESLSWHIRNFKMQSIDGCLMSSYALLIEENEAAGIKWDDTQKDKLAKELTDRFNSANKAQLEIKKACLFLDKSRPGYVALDSNYVVSNGLKYIAKSIKLPTANDQLGQWEQGF
jgi:hypothetical protein